MAAKVRIEYVRVLGEGDSETLFESLGGGQTVNISSSSVQSAAAPTFGAFQGRLGTTYARITPLAGAAIFTNPASNPTATEANGTRIDINEDPILVAIASGQKIAFIEAADAPASRPTSGGSGGSSQGAVATAAAPTYAEGSSVATSTDLAGNTRVIDLNVGAKVDSAATTDTGTFSLIALIKRLLASTTSMLTALTTPATVLPPTPLNTTSGLTVTPFSRAAISGAVLVAASSGKVIRVFRHYHVCEAAQRVEYWDGDPAAAGTLLRRFGYTSANGGGAVFDRDQDAYFQTTAGNGLYLKTTTAAETDGSVGFTQV